MNSPYQIQFLRIAKLGKDYRIKNDPNIVLKAAKHNLREILAEMKSDSLSHIDPSLSHLNFVLRGKKNSAGVIVEMNELLEAAGVLKSKKIRSNTIRGVELVFSLPVNSSIDPRSCFADFVAWVESFYTGIPILSAVAHLDEGAPHVHVILLPIVGENLQGHFVMGNRNKIFSMRSSCYESIGKKYGLQLTKRESLNNQDSMLSAKKCYETICSRPSLLRDREVNRELIKLLSKSPESVARAIRQATFKLEAKLKGKTFVGIMTKRCKPERINQYKPALG